jgi:hypothetical protein
MRIDTDKLAEVLQSHLQNSISGSGWDSNWEVSVMKNGIASMWYHALNTNGYYDGYGQLIFKLGKDFFKNVQNFTLQCSSSTSWRDNYYTNSKDYFEECFLIALETFNPKLSEVIYE